MAEFYRKRLPHWQPAEATFFVTYRLAGSIPMEKIREFREMPARKIFKKSKNLLSAWFFRCSDKYLDSNPNGPYWLANQAVADIVYKSLLFNHGRLYNLHALCIMSNHVHVLFTAGKDAPELSRILQQHKGFTRRESNLILGRTGQFWELESYDHVVRNNIAFQSILWYILNNPVKARLVNNWKEWKYSWVNPLL